MSSRTLTLYVGVTNDIRRRTREHKEKRVTGFSARYNVSRLVYYELHSDIRQAIAREKQIKVWRRDRKIALIRSVNPELRDLGAGW